MKAEILLYRVVDQTTFIQFVKALVEDRGLMADENYPSPVHLLDACLGYFVETPIHSPRPEPSWRTFAEFLYHGKFQIVDAPIVKQERRKQFRELTGN